jgi:methyltransferase (TIGR00027 family)
MENQSSLTAEYMALFRALESSRPADTRLFSDPYAPLFLHSWRKCLSALAKCGVGRGWIEALIDRNAPGARSAGIARTRWIDDEAEQALAVVPQLVLLGAGFDTRAYRLPAMERVTAFELDFPTTSRAKRAVFQRRFGVLPAQVRFVEIDFNSHSLAGALQSAGFDHAQPACFIWEGVTNYLSAEAIDQALRQIALSAPGSILLFTYIHRDVLDHPERFPGAAEITSRLHSYGEPWTFGLHPDEIRAYLAARGLRLMKDVGIAEVREQVGGSVRGQTGYEFYRLASACIEGPQLKAFLEETASPVPPVAMHEDKHPQQ